jgi:hypothetical protein
MMLLFRGDEAVRKVRGVVGNLSPDRRGGETIRDTYSDLIIGRQRQRPLFRTRRARRAECGGSGTQN